MTIIHRLSEDMVPYPNFDMWDEDDEADNEDLFSMQTDICGNCGTVIVICTCGFSGCVYSAHDQLHQHIFDRYGLGVDVLDDSLSDIDRLSLQAARHAGESEAEVCYRAILMHPDKTWGREDNLHRAMVMSVDSVNVEGDLVLAFYDGSYLTVRIKGSIEEAREIIAYMP